jgi:hypothetical protein
MQIQYVINKEETSEPREMRTDEAVEAMQEGMRDGWDVQFGPEKAKGADWTSNLEEKLSGEPPLNPNNNNTSSSNPYRTPILHKRTLGAPHISQNESSTSSLRTPYPPNPVGSNISSRVSHPPPYPTARILDRGLSFSHLPISRWTDVSSDEPFLQGLLRTYFLHVYPLNPVLHKDVFLDDLLAGKEDFCSSLVVNSVLAAGSAHSQTEIESRARGDEFRCEARRLWDIEKKQEARQRIITVQAAMILSAIHAAEGESRKSIEYWEQGVLVAETLDLFDEPAVVVGDAVEGENYLVEDESASRQMMHKERRQKMKMARTATAWGVFGMQALCFDGHKQLPLETAPSVVLPGRGDAARFFGEIWATFPGSDLVRPLHLGLTFIASAELATLRAEIASNINRNKEHATTQQGWAEGKKGISLATAGRWYRKLTAWIQNLPVPLRTENVVFPGHLLLHIHYHILLLNTFIPLLDVEALFIPADGSSAFTDYVDYSPKKIVQGARAKIEELVEDFGEQCGARVSEGVLRGVLGMVGRSGSGDWVNSAPGCNKNRNEDVNDKQDEHARTILEMLSKDTATRYDYNDFDEQMVCDPQEDYDMEG